MARKSRKNFAAEPICTSEINTAINTALYIRLSVEDGHGRSYSIENQQLILNDYVSDKPEFKIFNTYIDNGLTGRNFDRPGFKRMLTDIENGRVNCVIVKDLSRLGRNSIDTGYYIEQYFVQHKIRFIAVNDMVDTADEKSTQNSILLPLKNMVNEAYALDISKKIKSAAHQSMLDGDFIGARAPYGYKKSSENCHKLIIDEETAPIVKQIFEWYVQGKGLNTITVLLNEMGVVTSSVHKSKTSECDKKYKINRVWTSFTIAHILDNPVYMGDMVQGKSRNVEHKQQYDIAPEDYIVVRNTHEPIVSREIFEKAQEIRIAVCEEHKNKPLEPYNENIFKGKVFCSHCGKPLHRQRAKRKTKADDYYLHCLSKSRVSKDACVGVMMNEKNVMDYVSTAIKEKLSTLDITFSEAVANDNVTALLKKERTSKLRELERIQGLVKGLYESLVNGVISNTDYYEFKISYAEQIGEIKNEIEQIDENISHVEREQKVHSELKSCADSFKCGEKLTVDLISRLIERIEISHDHNIKVVLRSEEKESAL